MLFSLINQIAGGRQWNLYMNDLGEKRFVTRKNRDNSFSINSIIIKKINENLFRNNLLLYFIFKNK